MRSSELPAGKMLASQRDVFATAAGTPLSRYQPLLPCLHDLELVHPGCWVRRSRDRLGPSPFALSTSRRPSTACRIVLVLDHSFLCHVTFNRLVVSASSSLLLPCQVPMFFANIFLLSSVSSTSVTLIRCVPISANGCFQNHDCVLHPSVLRLRCMPYSLPFQLSYLGIPCFFFIFFLFAIA